MNKYNRIFIVGNNGAGKGVFAQELAKQLGWQFVNADVFGCHGQIGCSLKEALGQEGKSAFLKCLKKILQTLLKQENIVVTTDEAIVLDAGSRALLVDEFSVYLTVQPKTQVKRLTGYRPLLPVENMETLFSNVQEEYNKYFQDVASYSLSSDNGEIEEHVKMVLDQFRA